MMINYLAPIFRTQFNLFYRYGYTHIPASQAIKFDGKITNETKKEIVELFNFVSPFEYDEEYLILHLEIEEKDIASNIFFEIQNLISVYPLSKQAKISIESKIDTRIELEQPIFETVLSDIENNIHKAEIKKAIDALWLICKLEGGKEELLAAIEIENIFQGMEFRKSGTKATKIKDANYWSYLLAYDRFDFFPNTTLGYFYDAGQVFAFSKNHPTFEGSGLHKFLQSINTDNENIKLKEIIASIEKEESVKGYISQATDKNLKQYLVAPIYLMLKDELRNAEDVSQTKLVKYIDHLIEFGDSFKAAVILLGAFFGYKKFYDNYYDKLELRFYKSRRKETPPKKVEVEEKKTEEIKPESTSEKVEEINSVVNEPVIEIKKEAIEPPSVDQENLTAKFQEIVLSILKDFGEYKISELTKEFNKRTKRKFTNTNLEGILKEMKDKIELTHKGKKIEKVKLRSNATLFDTTT